MIDLHAHYLPGIDDGPSTMEEALAMAALAEAEGIRSVIVTPHYMLGQYEPSPERIRAGVADLQARAVRQGLRIAFHPGAELHLSDDLPQWLERGQALTLNGTRYLLLELPFGQFPLMTRQLFFELAVKGYRPILAHVERYLPIQQDPGLVSQWAQAGVLAQVTTGSLLGRHGEQARHCARRLLRGGLAQFLATDAHDLHLRSPRVREAQAIAVRWLGQRRAAQLLEENPMRVLSGQRVSIDLQEPTWRLTWRARRGW